MSSAINYAPPPTVDAGAFGAPSFLVGDELFFGKDRLHAVEEEIQRQSRAA